MLILIFHIYLVLFDECGHASGLPTEYPAEINCSKIRIRLLFHVTMQNVSWIIQFMSLTSQKNPQENWTTFNLVCNSNFSNWSVRFSELNHFPTLTMNSKGTYSFKMMNTRRWSECDWTSLSLGVHFGEPVQFNKNGFSPSFVELNGFAKMYPSELLVLV